VTAPTHEKGPYTPTSVTIPPQRDEGGGLGAVVIVFPTFGDGGTDHEAAEEATRRAADAPSSVGVQRWRCSWREGEGRRRPTGRLVHPSFRLPPSRPPASIRPRADARPRRQPTVLRGTTGRAARCTDGAARVSDSGSAPDNMNGAGVPSQSRSTTRRPASVGQKLLRHRPVGGGRRRRHPLAVEVGGVGGGVAAGHHNHITYNHITCAVTSP